MTKRRSENERLERSDREYRIAVDAERTERQAKSARLREQRLLLEAQPKTVRSVEPKPRVKKLLRQIVIDG